MAFAFLFCFVGKEQIATEEIKFYKLVTSGPGAIGEEGGAGPSH